MRMYLLPHMSSYIKTRMCYKTGILPMPLGKATRLEYFIRTAD